MALVPNRPATEPMIGGTTAAPTNVVASATVAATIAPSDRVTTETRAASGVAAIRPMVNPIQNVAGQRAAAAAS